MSIWLLLFNFQASLSALISNRLLLYISLYRAYNDHIPLWIVHKDLASGSYNWEYYSPNVIRLNEVSYKKIFRSQVTFRWFVWENYITIAGFEHFPIIYHSFFFVIEKLFSQCGRTCSISSIWKLIRNENVQAPPQTCWIRNSGDGGPAICAFPSPLETILEALARSLLKHFISRTTSKEYYLKLFCWKHIKPLWWELSGTLQQHRQLPPPPHCDNQNVSRHFQVSPGGSE